MSHQTIIAAISAKNDEYQKRRSGFEQELIHLSDDNKSIDEEIRKSKTERDDLNRKIALLEQRRLENDGKEKQVTDRMEALDNEQTQFLRDVRSETRSKQALKPTNNTPPSSQVLTARPLPAPVSIGSSNTPSGPTNPTRPSKKRTPATSSGSPSSSSAPVSKRNKEGAKTIVILGKNWSYYQIKLALVTLPKGITYDEIYQKTKLSVSLMTKIVSGKTTDLKDDTRKRFTEFFEYKQISPGFEVDSDED